MRVTGRSVSSSIRTAARTRAPIRYWCGVVPATRRNTRRKWNGLSPHRGRGPRATAARARSPRCAPSPSRARLRSRRPHARRRVVPRTRRASRSPATRHATLVEVGVHTMAGVVGPAPARAGPPRARQRRQRRDGPERPARRAVRERPRLVDDALGHRQRRALVAVVVIVRAFGRRCRAAEEQPARPQLRAGRYRRAAVAERAAADHRDRPHAARVDLGYGRSLRPGCTAPATGRSRGPASRARIRSVPGTPRRCHGAAVRQSGETLPPTRRNRLRDRVPRWHDGDDARRTGSPQSRAEDAARRPKGCARRAIRCARCCRATTRRFSTARRGACVRIAVSGESEWDVILAGRPGAGRGGDRAVPDDATLTADHETWGHIATDLRGGMDAFRSGRLLVRRNLHLGVGFLAATSGMRRRRARVPQRRDRAARCRCSRRARASW